MTSEQPKTRTSFLKTKDGQRFSTSRLRHILDRITKWSWQSHTARNAAEIRSQKEEARTCDTNINTFKVNLRIRLHILYVWTLVQLKLQTNSVLSSFYLYSHPAGGAVDCVVNSVKHAHSWGWCDHFTLIISSILVFGIVCYYVTVRVLVCLRLYVLCSGTSAVLCVYTDWNWPLPFQWSEQQ